MKTTLIIISILFAIAITGCNWDDWLMKPENEVFYGNINDFADSIKLPYQTNDTIIFKQENKNTINYDTFYILKLDTVIEPGNSLFNLARSFWLSLSIFVKTVKYLWSGRINSEI